jgi:glyoxylase-like metal-dependent hydrolase (beta-lactamase superfamily II)
LAAPSPVFGSGGVRVYLFNAGDFPIEMKDVFGDEAARSYFGHRPPKALFPSNSVLIVTPGARVLVDPGDSARVRGAAPPASPPRLTDQLAGAGFLPQGVTHVVVTHLHFDHYAGVTREAGGRWEPSFPRARHIVPAKDWDMPDIAEAREKGDPEFEGTLGVLYKRNLVDLVDGPVEVAPGVTALPYPGETPGHQVVAVSAGEGRCYCVGDLFHVPEEVDHPELVASWADRGALLSSKERFVAAASREGALVLGGHMGPGKIAAVGGRPKWTPV